MDDYVRRGIDSSRLRRPEETRKRSAIPRFNSTFRYTGNYTYHQARQLLLDRPNPDFERTLSKRMSQSLHICTVQPILCDEHHPCLFAIVAGGQMNQPGVAPFLETRQITIPEVMHSVEYRGISAFVFQRDEDEDLSQSAPVSSSDLSFVALTFLLLSRFHHYHFRYVMRLTTSRNSLTTSICLFRRENLKQHRRSPA